MMNDRAAEQLGKRAEDLNARMNEFSETVRDINRYFRNLGLGTPVWYPEKVHTSNLGGVIADCFLGYSRVEGKWGLNIRIIEREQESLGFVSQRVYSIESSGNMELVTAALRKVPALIALIDKTLERQVKALSGADREFAELRKLGGVS